jgi:chemotaxis methyl-accepting protein methylase
MVGLVASAGGIEAMLQLFALLRPNGRCTYIVAQHMGSRAHTELMTRVLRRTSALPIVTAQPLQPLRADTIYFIPAGHNGAVTGDGLQLLLPAPEHISTPSGNVLFASMAAQCGPHCTGVVLAGTGVDGVEGARAIRRAGGTVLVQDPASATFNGMPNATIEARLAHAVAPLDVLAELLHQPADATTAHPGTFAPSGSGPALGAPLPTSPQAAPGDGLLHCTPQDWQRWLVQLHQATGVDFAGYKPETLQRRLQQRLAALGLADLGAYLAHCQRQPGEWQHMQQRLLVSYSFFWRDRDAFAALQATLASAWRQRPPGAPPLRLWVPACASGEEAYSLALLLAELWQDTDTLAQRVQILGSDLNTAALHQAQVGRYAASALREVEPGWLQRYFTPHGLLHEIHPALRACCSFEVRDVLASAPTGPFDLVSCRNLLIYLQPAQQTQLLQSIHSVLRPGGWLFISTVESLDSASLPRFRPAPGTAHHLYQRRDGASP